MAHLWDRVCELEGQQLRTVRQNQPFVIKDVDRNRGTLNVYPSNARTNPPSSYPISRRMFDMAEETHLLTKTVTVDQIERAGLPDERRSYVAAILRHLAP